jgi:hypothetical protein
VLLPGKPRKPPPIHHSERTVLRNAPLQLAAPNSMVATCGRLIMSKKIKAHSLTGRITPELMRKAFKNV